MKSWRERKINEEAKIKANSGKTVAINVINLAFLEDTVRSNS